MLCFDRKKRYEYDGGPCKINDIGAINGIVSVELFIEETCGLNDLNFGLIFLDCRLLHWGYLKFLV
jgi:hypothetical protein